MLQNQPTALEQTDLCSWQRKSHLATLEILQRVFVEAPFVSLPLQQIKIPELPPFPQETAAGLVPAQHLGPSRSSQSRAEPSAVSQSSTGSFCASLPSSCRESPGGWELSPTHPGESSRKDKKGLRKRGNRASTLMPGIGILSFLPACSNLF